MRKILFIFLLLLSVSTRAEDFKILFLNTESIRIGPSQKKVGDVFTDGEKIYWKDGKQAMKVLSLESKKQYVFVSEDFKQRKMKSAKDYVVKSHRLSTRGIDDLASVAASIGDRLYWIDSVLLYIDFDPKEGESFVLKYDDKNIRLPFVDKQLVFDSRIWGETIPYPIEADLFYIYSDGEEELVNSDFMLIPLPHEVSLRKR